MGSDLLLAAGAVAGPLFTAVYLVTGALRPDYRPVRHPVSSLALGPGGWTQTANFLVAGVLTVAFAIGLGRTEPWGAALVGIWGAGLVGAAAFRTDPVSGYPPGSPDRLEASSRAGRLHDGLSLAGFLALAAACGVLAADGPVWWTVYSIASGAVFLATMAAASAAFGQHPRLAAYGGLIQRIAISVGWAWQFVLAVRIARG